MHSPALQEDNPGRAKKKEEKMIVIYRHPRLKGKNCYIDADFKPLMAIFCSLLEKYNLICHITSSWRADTVVPGAIVKPAQKGNHLVGHAVDANFIDKEGVWWNSNGKAPGTKDLENATGDMLSFIHELLQNGWRWGKAFNQPDDVHWDDGLNVRNPQKWTEIYNKIHSIA